MYEVSARARFSAAHRLAGYKGACASVHGHNWEVEVFVRGEELDPTGILVDFRELKRAIGEALSVLDHADLNEVEVFRRQNPTSENIARFIYERLSAALDCDRYTVDRVHVGETPETGAMYTRRTPCGGASVRGQKKDSDD